MTDLRNKQPAVRTLTAMPSTNYEVELKAWTYHGVKNEDVISGKLIYHVAADNFTQAHNIAVVLCDAVRAMPDIHVAEIVRIEEWRK